MKKKLLILLSLLMTITLVACNESDPIEDPIEEVNVILEQVIEKNHIPQNVVDRAIDLILEYMESIGQYGFDINEN